MKLISFIFVIYSFYKFISTLTNWYESSYLFVLVLSIILFIVSLFYKEKFIKFDAFSYKILFSSLIYIVSFKYIGFIFSSLILLYYLLYEIKIKNKKILYYFPLALVLSVFIVFKYVMGVLISL